MRHKETVQVCSTGSCKTLDRIWGIVKGNKIHRLTFSKSLAEHIVQKNKEYSVQRFEFQIGKPLQRSEISRTGFYGIISTSKQIALRISLIRECAEYLTQDESRYLAEVSLRPVGGNL